MWKMRRARGPLRKLTCMSWRTHDGQEARLGDGVHPGIKEITGEVIEENRNGVWLTRTLLRKTARERGERRNFFSSHRQSSTGSVVVTTTCATSPLSQITFETQMEVIVTVPWHKNKDYTNIDGEPHKGGLVMIGIKTTRQSWIWKDMFSYRKECA